MTPLLTTTSLSMFIPVPFLVAAAAIDLRTQRIPNYLTLSAMLVALIFHSIVGGADGFLFSFLGALAGMGLLFLPYLMGGMGAGDAKLLGAVGAFVGAKGVFFAFLFTGIAGGAYALTVLIFQRSRYAGLLHRQLETIKAMLLHQRLFQIKTSAGEHRPRLCYGLAISLGSIAYIVLTLTGYRLPA